LFGLICESPHRGINSGYDQKLFWLILTNNPKTPLIEDDKISLLGKEIASGLLTGIKY